MRDPKLPQTNRRGFVVGTTAAASSFLVGNSAFAGPPEECPTKDCNADTDCGKQGKCVENDEGQKHCQWKIKLATVAPRGTPWSKQLRGIKKRLQAESCGGFKVKAYLGGALGGEIETLERCKRGTVQIWGGTAGALSSKIPEFGCFELPYLFPNLKAADKVIDSLRLEIEGLLWKNGFKLLFMSENGRRSIGANFGFIKSPGDLKGKKMRSQQSDVHLNTWRALGASPVPISVTEVLTSLQTGAVDGFDNTELFTFAGSWYQAITHFTLTRHSYQPGFVIASRKFWDDLPKDMQTMLLGDPQAEADKGRRDIRKLEPALVKNFENAGIAVHTSTDSEKKAFAAATRKTHDMFKKKYKGAGAKLLNGIYRKL
jgi:TRAP-type C4-dicarboxylate transport system substrate-binding protein